MKRSGQNQQCVYCGEAATTRDHVPPKAILRKPFPQLITVPACRRCNGNWAPLDEKFRNVIALVLGDHTSDGREFWDTRVVKGVRRGGPSSHIVVNVEVKGLEVDASVVGPMLERLVRGLLYDHLKLALPPDVPVEVRMVLSEEAEKKLLDVFSEEFKYRRIGNDFEVWYGFDAEEIYSSYWLMRFYRSLIATGTTGPAAARLRDAPSTEQAPLVIARAGKLRLK